jgi:hypothetical protein
MPGFIIINKSQTYSSSGSISLGSFLINVSSTSGIELGDILTKTSGTGSFNDSAEFVYVTALTSTTITVSHTHSGSGTISFIAGTNIKNSFSFPDAESSIYNKGIRNSSGNLLIDNISGTDTKSMYTTTTGRGDSTFVDITTLDLPIYTNNNVIRIVRPNTIIRPIHRLTILEGSANEQTLGNLRRNTLSSTPKNIIVALHGAGGGGGGSGNFGGSNATRNAGGGGGGSGGFRLVRLNNSEG